MGERRARKRKPRLQPRLLMDQGGDLRREWWEQGSFKQYAELVCLKQRWRCSTWMSQEDLLGEAYLCFLDTCRRYYWALRPQHLMSLYKRCLHTVFTELSYRGSLDRMRSYELANVSLRHVRLDFDETLHSDTLETIAGDGLELLEFEQLLRALPRELKEVLYCLLYDARETLSSQRASRKRMSHRETTNEVFCRLIGADPAKQDLAGSLRKILLEGT